MSPPPTSGRTRPRLDAAAWIEAALDSLADGGLKAIAVEPLARRLGVTKGSFYWHFDNRRALLEAALDRWEGRYTERAVHRFGTIADPRQRLIFAFGEATRLDRGDRVHLALSAHADDPLIGPYIQRGTRRRISYLQDCYREMGLDSEEARHRSVLTYTAYLGLMHLRREGPAELPGANQFDAYLEHVLATFLPPKD